MSYAIYKTPAIIIRSIPDREANADVVFLTRDLGKITVRAQAARKLESKHRMQLGRYNHVMIDVVRGAHIWRLTGIHQIAAYRLFTDNKILHAFHRAATLAEHLIRGEEPHAELFDFFVGLLDYIDKISGNVRRGTREKVPAPGQSDFFTSTSPDMVPFFADGLELFAVIKVLEHLGYWSGEKFPEMPNDEILKICVDQKTELVAAINEGIRATQIT